MNRIRRSSDRRRRRRSRHPDTELGGQRAAQHGPAAVVQRLVGSLLAHMPALRAGPEKASTTVRKGVALQFTTDSRCQRPKRRATPGSSAQRLAAWRCASVRAGSDTGSIVFHRVNVPAESRRTPPATGTRSCVRYRAAGTPRRCRHRRPAAPSTASRTRFAVTSFLPYPDTPLLSGALRPILEPIRHTVVGLTGSRHGQALAGKHETHSRPHERTLTSGTAASSRSTVLTHF